MLDRKRWTQKLIADTLKELSKNKSLSRITVTDICQGCGINRSTFYYHFTDRDDVIQWMFRHDIEEHFVQVTDGQWVKNTLHLLTIRQRDIAFYSQAVKLDTQQGLRNCIFEATLKKCYEIIAESLGGRDMRDEDMDFIARFYSHAFTEMNMEYIHAGAKEAPESTIKKYVACSIPGLKNSIDALASGR